MSNYNIRDYKVFRTYREATGVHFGTSRRHEKHYLRKIFTLWLLISLLVLGEL